MKERDILIFPKFDNIDKIQKIREKNDRLYDKIMPHITIVFPFLSEMSNSEISLRLENLVSNFGKFKVDCRGVSLSNDNYIFLNCTEGEGEGHIVKLHDEIYSKIFPLYLREDIPYIPHITLGQSEDINFLKDFEEDFEAIIEEIILEEIGDNEESIIVNRIKLD